MRNSDVLNLPNIYNERFTQTLSNNIQRPTQANIISENQPSQLATIINKDEEFIPRETLTSVYGDSYELTYSNLQEIEKETMNYFSNLLSELNNKYLKFNSNINLHFKGVTNKIANAFKLNNPAENIKNIQRNSLIQKHSNEYLQQLNKILNMHEQIFQNIKDSISIFFNFLDISKILDKEKPIQEFIGKEFNSIIQNWLFLKINIEDFDFAQAISDSSVDDNFKNFISKICKDKNFVMNISCPKQYMINCKKNYENLSNEAKNKINIIMEKNKKVMSDNHSNLTKLKMCNIFRADKYFEKDLTYDKMRYLKFDNVLFDQEKAESNNFLKNIPKLERLVINSSNNFDISLLKDLSKSLIKLSLTKNGFVDYDFNNIMSNYLVKSDAIRKNLQVLSFSNNNLSNVDFTQLVYQPKQSFYALKELDFQKNKIYKFNISPEFFVELKCINCCSNCFTKSNFEQYNNILTFLSGNIFLSQLNLAKNYFSNLEKNLKNFNISLSYLNLSYIPKILSNDYLSNLVINDLILINLKKLDLSHNNIICDTIFNFFEHNKGSLNLKSLNLSYNLLDDSFFEKFLNLKLNNLFNKLKYINLDSNNFGKYTNDNIKENSLKMKDILFHEEINKEKDIIYIRLLYKFISENKNLIEMSITKNPIGNRFLVKNIEDNANGFNFNNFVKKDENDNIAINCFYSFLWKIKIDLIKKKSNTDNSNDNEVRSIFNLKFDCINSFNNNFENFYFNKKYIIFKN